MLMIIPSQFEVIVVKPSRVGLNNCYSYVECADDVLVMYHNCHTLNKQNYPYFLGNIIISFGTKFSKSSLVETQSI